MSCINEEIITWTLMHEIGGVPPLISFHYMLSEFTAFHKRSNAWFSGFIVCYVWRDNLVTYENTGFLSTFH